ncbi:MAG: hypothetical protein OEY26_00460 [Nitrospinota bacterium]|jgi:hypothetical protein|nr:hypothetical protein [Nitrospinota bacterium]MDH5788981.1 hypothetical protein [Nitrospinota bacterium]
MLAFAKDITQKEPKHPEEGQNAKLKEYMDYQRKINHEKLVYHSLEHAKNYLQKTINDMRGDENKLKGYLKQAFPVAHRYADSDTLMLMLRKLLNAHNATNNWYRLNRFYSGLVYDAMSRFIQIYNRLVKEAPEKSDEYDITDKLEVDFDDWVRLFFHDLDFLIGQPLAYVHFTFRKRNLAIENSIQEGIDSGKSREEAIKEASKQFNIEEDAVTILSNKSVDEKNLELFYTSVENPIYEFLYDTASEEGFMDGECLIDHSYFLSHQLKGLSEKDAELVVSEIERLSKH